MHIYSTCLFKESVFLWKSNLPLYQKLEVPESCSTLHHLIMVASCLQEIDLWYPSFGLQVLIVISVVLKKRLLQVNGLEVGLPAFQLPMLAKCDAVPERDLCVEV